MVLFAELLKELQKQTPRRNRNRNPHRWRTRTGWATAGVNCPPTCRASGSFTICRRKRSPAPAAERCGHVIGQEISEQLDYVPAKLKVIEHVRLKYVCRTCEQTAAEGGPQIATAEKPLSPIEKGLAAPGLLAYVIVSKYGDQLPLHRLEKILERHDIEIARSTMCDWMRQSAEALQPLYDLMVREVLASKVIHTDDTPVDVLDRERSGTRTGRFWVYLGDSGSSTDGVRLHPQPNPRRPDEVPERLGQRSSSLSAGRRLRRLRRHLCRPGRRHGDRGGLLGPCPAKVLRGPDQRPAPQRPGPGVHPAAVRRGRSSQRSSILDAEGPAPGAGRPDG